MSKWFTVNVKIDRESEFDITIEADSEEDAEEIAVKDERNLSFVTQTTLSTDDTQEIIAILKERFPLSIVNRPGTI